MHVLLDPCQDKDVRLKLFSANFNYLMQFDTISLKC